MLTTHSTENLRFESIESGKRADSEVFDWFLIAKPSSISKLLIGRHSTKSDPHPQTTQKSVFKQQIHHIQSIPHHKTEG